MNRKRPVWRIWFVLAAALVIALIPISEAMADRGHKHPERRDVERGMLYERETVTLAFPDGSSISAVIHQQQGRLLIPAQQVFDARKIPYILYPKGSILEGFANGKHFIFHAGKRVMYLDGQKKRMAAEAMAVSDQIYAPLQTAAEVLGWTAVIKPENKTIEFKMR